ncbi:MAG: ROK family transcriptional regulator [Thermotogota bacterium]
MKSKSINALKMGVSNKIIILDLIRYEPGITRREIAGKTGLNPSTVTNIINSLKEMNFAFETGKKSTSNPGRNSIKLGIVKEAASVFAFHTSVEETIFGVGHMDNTVEILKHFPTHDNPSLFFDQIAQTIKKEYEQMDKKPFGISFSFPGIVNRLNNQINILPHLGWKGILVEEELKKRLGEFNLEVRIANEAKLSLKSEKAVNPAIKELKNGVYLYLSQGVGGAVLINDIIYTGTNFIAGEIGHMSINKNGPICRCGNRGCLETYIGIDMIIKQYEEFGKLEGKDTRNQFKRLIKRYLEGEEKAIETIEDMLSFMEQGVANITNIYNPDFIIIGGMGCELPESVFNRLNDKIKTKALTPAGENVLIIPSSLDVELSTLHGSTIEAMDEYVRTVIV